MHVAAAAPKFLKGSDMDENFIKREEEIYRTQLIEQGKPENMIGNILKGKVAKLASEVCLLEQKFVMDPDTAIKKYVEDTAKKAGVKLEVKSPLLFALAKVLRRKKIILLKK